MINTNLLASIFEKYNIDSVSYLEDNNDYIFLIKTMNSSISLEKWEYLEQTLKYLLKADVSFLSYDYAKNYIDISKAMVIKKWATI